MTARMLKESERLNSLVLSVGWSGGGGCQMIIENITLHNSALQLSVCACRPLYQNVHISEGNTHTIKC